MHKSNKASSSTPPTSTAASTKPASEKFPKKLQAFPFVPGATTNELTKAHKFFFSPAEFIKSATDLSMIPDNTMIPEVNIICYIRAMLQVSSSQQRTLCLTAVAHIQYFRSRLLAGVILASLV